MAHITITHIGKQHNAALEQYIDRKILFDKLKFNCMYISTSNFNNKLRGMLNDMRIATLYKAYFYWTIY